eukprot:Nk52_evm24s242 gene=Nk52_evmTU24s242
MEYVFATLRRKDLKALEKILEDGLQELLDKHHDDYVRKTKFEIRAENAQQVQRMLNRATDHESEGTSTDEYSTTDAEEGDYPNNLTPQPRFSDIKHPVRSDDKHLDRRLSLTLNQKALKLNPKQRKRERRTTMYIPRENINTCDDEGWTLLHRAADMGKYKAMRLLLRAGADPNCVDNSGWTPLHRCAWRGMYKCVDILTEELSEEEVERTISSQAYTGDNWSGTAAEGGEALFDNNNNKGPQGLTMPSVKITAESLMSLNMNSVSHNKGLSQCPSKSSAEGGSVAQQSVAESEKSKVLSAKLKAAKVKLMLEHKLAPVKSKRQYRWKIDIDAQTCEGWTALFCSVWNHQLDNLDLLLKRGASPNIANTKGWSPVYVATRNGGLSYLRLLIGAGANTNIKTKDKFSAGHRAARNGFYECLKLLIQGGMFVNSRDFDGFNLAHHAVMGNQPKCLKLLINSNVDVNMQGFDDSTPLHIAAKEGRLKCMVLLVGMGRASVNIRDHSDSTPLKYTAEKGHVRCLDYLIKRRASVNSLDIHGWSPCHWAAANGHLACLKLLVHGRAAVKFKNEDKLTPREEAGKCGWGQCVRFLKSCEEALQKSQRRYTFRPGV